jgi:hypothetical protein
VLWSIELGGARVDWIGASGQVGHAVWIVRKVEGGHCVVGIWSAEAPVESGVVIADRRVTTGGRTAVVLLRFTTVADERSEISTRWVLLASDGNKAWVALDGRGGTLLIAREARLRPQGSALYLDVSTESTATAVLRFDGTRFVKIN